METSTLQARPSQLRNLVRILVLVLILGLMFVLGFILGNQYSEVNPNIITTEDSSGETSDEDEISVEDRLIVTSPITDQIFDEGVLVVSGEMKGFFEGVLNFRLIVDGNVVLSDFATADGDNYEDFVSFSKTSPFMFAVGDGSDAVVEFYSISAKDGSEEVILSVPIRIEPEQVF